MGIHILRLITSAYGGGAQKGVIQYIENFNQVKFKPYVVTIRTGNLSTTFKKYLANDYICLNQKNRFSIKILLALIKFIKKNNINIIHTHLIEADIYGFILKILFPTKSLIASRHGPNRFRTKIYWGIINFIISIPTKKIICVSKSLKDFIRKQEFIPSKKIIHIYNGIDLNRFKTVGGSLLPEEFKDFNLKTTTIGVIGRLKRLKGHDILFEAVKTLKQKGIKNIRIIVIGEGKHLETLENLRDRLNLWEEIEFVGYKKNIQDYYKSIDILCSPSKYEGLSNVLLEAMASETLILCSDIPGNIEIISHGYNGVVFKSGDSNDLALKIQEIYKGLYNITSIKKNAQKDIESKFDIKTNTKELEKVYLDSVK